MGRLRFQKLWDSGIGLSAWLVRLSVTDVYLPAVASEPSRPAIIQELKDRLFGHDDCHIIELGNAPSSTSLLIMAVVTVPYHAGAGTGIVSLVLAALRSANPTSGSSSTSNHRTCILSTDLRESSRSISDWHLYNPPNGVLDFLYSVFDGAHVV